MNVTERQPGDRQRLIELVRREKSALLRDRYRAVSLALDGQQALEIAAKLGRARRPVQRWVYLYRDGGLDALLPRPRGRMKPKLPVEQHAAFKARMLAGPTDADEGKCTLRGLDAVRILEAEFGQPGQALAA
jgi:transposase